MDRKTSVVELPINASPKAVHQRQMIWQVWVPLGISIAIILALAILAIIGTVQGSSQVNRWGNISAVFLIIPVLLVGLIFLALLAAIIYGLSKLLKKMPDWMLVARMWMARLSVIVRQGANSASRPIIAVNAWDARARAFWNKVFKG